ncbi:MAG: SDR family NAD(P)-dependent oxidoreductase [Chitinivibrionales bacterium]|nr:SDR family NAD(P)-dependent oxidoreductase [Chitinivibrionales bacterium]
MSSKKNKAILITGATKRLGLNLTKQSLKLGFSVIAHFRNDFKPLQTWLRHNPTYRNKVFFIQRDLRYNCQQLIADAATFPVQLVGLVNNAAIFSEGSLLEHAHFHETLLLNSLVPLRCATAFAQAVKSGWIINMTDAYIGTWNKKYQNYRISKLLLTELTRQLAVLLAPAIRVNALAPGPLLPHPKTIQRSFDRLKEKSPLQKTGDIPALLHAYELLITNTSLCGQVLYIDNGLHALQG